MKNIQNDDNSSEINKISPNKELLIKPSEEFHKKSRTKSKTRHKSNKSNQLKNTIYEILSKDSDDRNSQELLIVGDYLSKHYNYFINLKNSDSQLKMDKIAKICKLEKFGPNETIILYGDIGDKFYIVLEGQVEVYLPEYFEKEMSQYEFMQILEKTKRIDKLKYERLKSKNINFNFDNVDLSMIEGNTNFMKNKFNFFLEKDDKKGEYGEGFSFGEIALIKRTTRNATIKSIDNTICLSISKNDYIEAMKEIESKKLVKDIDSFKKKYQFFNCFSSERMIRIFNCFKKVILYKGDYLFHQNDINDYIYLVVRGNFEVYSYISYSWLNEYYDFIDDSLGNIFFYMISNPNLKFDELQELIKNIKLNVTNSPMKNLDYSLCNDITMSNKNNLKDNLYYIKRDEEQMNNNTNIFKIELNKVDYNEIFGLEDCFDFKRKFYSVKCVSDSAELKCIKISDLIRIIWNSKRNDYLYILRLIINKKNILKNKIINSVKNLEKKILFGLDIRYENLINYENNAYNKRSETPNGFCLKEKIKRNYFNIKLNNNNYKKKELEVNKIISAIKVKGYNMSIQDILDKKINILSEEKSYDEKKMFLKKKTINSQILKSLLKNKRSNPHLFKFTKKLCKSFYSSESKNDSMISIFSPNSRKYTNCSTNNIGLKKIKNIIEFSGLSNDKEKTDDDNDINNNIKKLNKTNNFEQSLSLVNKIVKTPNYLSFFSNKKNQKIYLNKNIKRKSIDLINKQNSLIKFNSFIKPRFPIKSRTYITSAKYNDNFLRKSVSYETDNITMVKPFMSPQVKIENKRKDIFNAVRKATMIKKVMKNKISSTKNEEYLRNNLAKKRQTCINKQINFNFQKIKSDIK